MQMENLVDLIEICIVGCNWDVGILFQCVCGTDSRCAMHQAHITEVHSSELELILLGPHPRLLCVSCQWCGQQQQRLRGWHFQEPVLWTLEAVRQSPASLSHKSWNTLGRKFNILPPFWLRVHRWGQNQCPGIQWGQDSSDCFSASVAWQKVWWINLLRVPGVLLGFLEVTPLLKLKSEAKPTKGSVPIAHGKCCFYPNL